MRELPLLDRDSELAAIAAAIGAIPGEGSIVYFEAAPGLGKSRLLQLASQQAQRAGLLVLSARGTVLEQGFAFGVAHRLFGPHVPAAGAARKRVLGKTAAAAGPLLDGSMPLAPGDPTRIGLIQALCALTGHLAGAAEHRGVLLAVDDAQWSDTASLRVMVSLAQHLDDVPVAIMVSARPAEPGERAKMLAELAGHAAARVFRLAPLGPDAISAMIDRRYGPDAEPEFVRACAETTGGNPFLLEELLRNVMTDGVAPTAAGAHHVAGLVPESVLRSVAVRLGRLDSDAGALAAAIAILGDGTPLRHAAALANLDPLVAEGAADALGRAGILRTTEPLEIIHPLIASAILADLPEFGRRRARRRAAELLGTDGAPVERVCAQLLHARGEGDAWAVTQLRLGARGANQRGEPSAAVELLTRALAEPPAADQRADVLTELAQAEAAAGDPGALDHLEQALALIEDRRYRARAFHALAQLHFPRGDYLAAAAAAQRGLDEMDPDDPLADELLATLLIAASSHPSMGEGALARLVELLGELAAGHPPQQPALCAVLSSTVAMLGGSAAEVRTLADAALAADPFVDRSSHGMVFGLVGTALVAVDELQALHSAADRAAAAAHARGSPIGLAIATQWRAAALCLAGELRESVRDGEAAREITRAGWKGIVGWNAFFLARAYLELGELDRAEAIIDAGLEFDDHPLAQAIMFEARGRVALAAGRFADALKGFLASSERLRPTANSTPAVFAWRPLAAVVARTLGHVDQAEEWIAEELAAVDGKFVPRVRAVVLRCAGLVRGGPDGLAMLSESVELLAGSPAALERAHSLVEHGAALRRAGQRVQAREQLKEALQLALSFDALPLTQRVREELAASGARLRRDPQAGRAALTPSEARVARLAAQRMLVPEIARALTLSPKTVEWHLGNVYSKLEVHSREELYAIWESDGD